MRQLNAGSIWKQSVKFLCVVLLVGAAVLQAGDKKNSGSLIAADKGKFNILLDGKSVGHEEFSIESAAGNWIAKGTTSIQGADGKSARITGNLSIQGDGVPIAYDWSSQADKTNGAHVTFTGGLAKTTLQMQGARPFEQENSFNSPLVVVLDNNLYHHYEIVAHIYDWSKRGSQSFSVLIPQELTPGTITVEATGSASMNGKSYDGLKVSTADLEVLLYLDATHRLMVLSVPSAKVSVVRE